MSIQKGSRAYLKTFGKFACSCSIKGLRLPQDMTELVWGLFCQAVVLGCADSFLFGAEKAVLRSVAREFRFPERAEGVKGPKR